MRTSRERAAPLFSLLLLATFSAGCPVPQTVCAGDEECAARWGVGTRCVAMEAGLSLCQRPCADDTGCASGRTCIDGACELGARDAGVSDSGPKDAGTDAGGCAGDEVDCGAGCVDAALVDGSWVPSTAEHCGACGVTVLGCREGAPVDCDEASDCGTAPANGSFACSPAGECALVCDDAFAVCDTAPGACTPLHTLTDCTGCADDVSEVADTCVNGLPECGGAPACADDAPYCVQAVDESYACRACRDDDDCGSGGQCCGGACLTGAALDGSCGCAAQPGGDEGEDCSLSDVGKKCVDDVCGCDQSGALQCGSDDNGLPKLCDPSTTATGACREQDAQSCGALGGVVPFQESTAVDGAMCTVAYGGPLCVADEDGLGQCGCETAADCDSAHLDANGVPRRPADGCVGDGCLCGAGARCDDEDCVLGECEDLQSDVFNCGSRTIACGNPDFGAGDGRCFRGGCECDANDCEEVGANNVDSCQNVGTGFTACVCNGFRDVAGGARLACPMGLTCVIGGCDLPGAAGTPFATLEFLNAALGL